VSSLQDGMNLVAKEFIACNVDEQGVLVLSRFAGAAEEIEGAVLINPFNVDGFVAGLRDAIAMPIDDRRQRMHAMREALEGATIFDWMEGIMARVHELAPPAGRAERHAGAASMPADLVAGSAALPPASPSP
jgi:trehalose-6-phosphate synthase